MTLEQAAAFVERVGIAIVFPVVDLVLPSLWEEALHTRDVVVFVEDERGKRVPSRELREAWSLAERLARTRRVCVGNHIGRRYALLSRRALPALRALSGSDRELSPLRLQAMLVLTQAGEAAQEHGWDANYDLVGRRFPLRRLPPADRARGQLVELVLRAAREVSAADVAAALPLARREAENELERMTENGHALRLSETVYALAA